MIIIGIHCNTERIYQLLERNDVYHGVIVHINNHTFHRIAHVAPIDIYPEVFRWWTHSNIWDNFVIFGATDSRSQV